MSTTEELRRTAEALEQLDQGSVAGPWFVTDDYNDLVLVAENALDPEGDGLKGTYHCTDRIAAHDVCVYDPGDHQEQMVMATYHLMRTLRPATAAIVEQLRYAAAFVEKHYDGDFPESSLPEWVLTVLQVARRLDVKHG